MLTLVWTAGEEKDRCSLLELNLAHVHFDDLQGVYVIFHGGFRPRVVRVGQGVIRDRLKQHLLDKKITRYSTSGLHATWAKVDRPYRDAVEAFLAMTLTPLVGERFPDVTPCHVNIPPTIETIRDATRNQRTAIPAGQKPAAKFENTRFLE